MKDFKGKVAVVTGAASGIGRAIASRCAAEGMKVVASDIEEGPLRELECELLATGAQALGVVTDVSQADQMQALCAQTLARFGGVHLLFNNAGVAAGYSIWGSALSDWEWVTAVNVWGVVHGIRAFVPTMLAQNQEAHIVNTSSAGGLMSGAYAPIYTMTKHAVVSLSESLYNELQMVNEKIGVSVLCPGYVRTRIIDSARNRPVPLAAASAPMSEVQRVGRERFRAMLDNGMPADECVARLFKAITDRKFYVVTHDETRAAIHDRANDILLERNPTLSAMWNKNTPSAKAS